MKTLPPFKSITLAILLATLTLASTGCPESARGLVSRTIEHDTRIRSYELYVPQSLNEKQPVPLVIALHPFTSSGRGMAVMTEFNFIAERESFIIAYPDGILRRWDDAILDNVDDHGFLLAVIGELLNEFLIDPDRVYLTGASNGGFMTFSLACAAPQTFAAIATVMSAMPEELAAECMPPHPLPAIVIHGTDDTIVPFDGGEIFRGPTNGISRILGFNDTLAFWAGVNGITEPPHVERLPNIAPLDGTRAERITYLSNDGASPLLAAYRIVGGGHTWPGGGGVNFDRIVGTRSREISASEEIWAFFSQHNRQSPQAQLTPPTAP